MGSNKIGIVQYYSHKAWGSGSLVTHTHFLYHLLKSHVIAEWNVVICHSTCVYSVNPTNTISDFTEGELGAVSTHVACTGHMESCGVGGQSQLTHLPTLLTSPLLVNWDLNTDTFLLAPSLIPPPLDTWPV